MNHPTAVRAAPIQLAWGARVSTDFAKAIFALCKHLRWHPEHASWLMACMAFESSADAAQRWQDEVRKAIAAGR